jgi:phenylalanyl-tRNA synthetase beta chain
MGGLETEIGDSTRNILLESANFDFISIRRTTQALKLPSEASLRFGRGIHPSLCEPAVRRASELMRILGTGTIAEGMVDAYPVQPKPVVIDLTEGEVERNLGVPLEIERIADMLEPLEFECLPVSPDSLRVTVPQHRLDCRYAADLIEEVARIYGYDRIPVTDMADRLPPQRANRDLEMEEEVRDVLVGCGLQEVVTYSLTNLAREAALDPKRDATDLSAATYVALENPITQERQILRRSMLSTVLETVAANLRFRERVEVFEVGKVFLQDPDEELPAEPRHMAIVMTGPRREGRFWAMPRTPTLTEPVLDFFDVKGVIETLLKRLHVDGVVFEPAEHASFQPGRVARVSVDAASGGDGQGTMIGIVGEIQPAVRAAFELGDRRVAAAELDLEMLLAHVPSTWSVEPLSAYPAVLQDLAIVVDADVPAAAVREAILEAGGFLLKEVALFDVYQGDPVPEGKKSLAYALTFQAPDKTLRDAIVAKQVDRIMGRLSRDLGAELRS